MKLCKKSKKAKAKNKMAKIDFLQVEEGFPLWPEGEYPSVLSKAELKKAKSKHFGWNVEFEPESEDVKGKGFSNFSLHPNALWRTKQNLLRLGMDPDVWAEIGAIDSEDESTLQEINAKVQELIGNNCVLVITHQDYEDENELDEEGNATVKTRNNVEKILSAGATAFASLK